ncbi:MAG: miniconductance mechanosensitive channel [Flavobacterium sp.]|jgi:miniconductance mechanosensitive channel
MHKLLELLFGFSKQFLSKFIPDKILLAYSSLVINMLLTIGSALLLYYVFKRILVSTLILVAKKSRTTFDDLLVSNHTAKYIAHLIPFLFIYQSVFIILNDFYLWEKIFNKLVSIYIVILSIWIIRSVLKAFRDYLKLRTRFSDKPIDSYIQVFMIILWIFGFAIIISKIFNIKLINLYGTLGAISAIVILIFKDTLLGLVASIQVSLNDMVRIGDWITFDKYGADGDVSEINLATVKVRNFDNTITTIPTYALISDSFRNWRGMLDSKGRRIKRHVLIKAKSIRFLTKEDIAELKKIHLITEYLIQKEAEITLYNSKKSINKNLEINGRNLTNFGVFRKYITEYLENHPNIAPDMILMCRQLQPTSHGFPLEIYFFTREQRFVEYEYIMADIFDHIISSVVYFDLELLEIPTDFKTIDNKEFLN